MIFALVVPGAPNRLTATAFADVAFRPTQNGSFLEPARIRYLALSARVMTESEAFTAALQRVDTLTDVSDDEGGVHEPAAVVVDVGSSHRADRRLHELVAQLPQFRKEKIGVGRVALRPTVPMTGALPGVISRDALVTMYNSRAVALATEDPDDPARTAGKFIPSFRDYDAKMGDLERDEVLGRLSAANRLDARRIIPETESLVELSDDETVAAAVMLMLPAADLYAPMSGGLTDRIRAFRAPNLARR